MLNELQEQLQVVYTQMLSDIQIEYPDHVENLMIELVNIPRSIDLGSLYTANDIGAIWDEISSYPDGILRKILMTAGARFKARMNLVYGVGPIEDQTEQWNCIVGVVAGALGHIRDNRGDDTVMNKDYAIRGHDTAVWYKTLLCNQWLVFILLTRLFGGDLLEILQKKSMEKPRKNKGVTSL